MYTHARISLAVCVAGCYIHTSCAGVLGRAHTVAAMDQSKLQEASGSGLLSASSGGLVTAADLSDSTAWKKQRPGATFFAADTFNVSDQLSIACHNRFVALIVRTIGLQRIVQVVSLAGVLAMPQ